MPHAQHSLADAPWFGPALRTALVELWGIEPDALAVQKLKGDASTRRYYRVIAAERSPASVVVMVLPESDIADARARELPFMNVQRHLEALGVPVPRVYRDGSGEGYLLLEDLGDETFEARLYARPRDEWFDLYARAIDLLAELHERARAPRAGFIAHQRLFGEKLLRWELMHFREWALEALGIALTPSESRALDDACARLVAHIAALPRGFVHRDYQSRNLMWAPHDRLVVLDFQDALTGPAVYDLVALLCDSYVDLDEALQRSLIARMAHLRGVAADELERAFWLVSAQRKLKDAGRFVFLDQVRENPSFLPWFGPSLRYAGRALAHLSEFTALAELLAGKIAGFPDAVEAPQARTGAQRTRTVPWCFPDPLENPAQ